MRIYSISQIFPLVQDIQHNLGLNGRSSFVEHYRGQGLDSFTLLNGIARFNHKPENLLKRERKLFEKFLSYKRNGAFEFVQHPYQFRRFQYLEEWHALFQAQHLGLKTRLMDWSGRWETALLFAVENEKFHGMDGQFWVFICPRNLVINSGNFEELYNTHPLQINRSYMINAAFYSDSEEHEYIGERRRMRQGGKFFIQPYSKFFTPLENQEDIRPNLTRFIIDGQSKNRIKNELRERGLEIDWSYYRKDESIDEKILKLNTLILKKCRVS